MSCLGARGFDGQRIGKALAQEVGTTGSTGISLRQRLLNANLSALEHRQQRGHGSGIKPLPREVLNDAQSFHRIVRLLVRTVGGQSVKRVGDGNHARQQRNFVAFQIHKDSRAR